MNRSTEYKVLTRSAAKINFTAKNSNMPELRRSERIAKKRSYDEETLKDEKKHATLRLNDTKRRKYQPSTLCNKSSLRKEIIGNKVVKKQQHYKIAKSKESETLLRQANNNDVYTISSPSTYKNKLRSRITSDIINEYNDDMKLNKPSTSRVDLPIAVEEQNNDFCPSPKNLEELSIILYKIWERQQLKELDDNAI